MNNSTGPAVLVVDDDQSVIDIAEHYLLESGQFRSVVGATRGEEALHQLQRQAFDVMLLDLALPGLSGLDVLQQLGSRAPGELPVIIAFTSCRDTQIMARVLGAGAQEYFHKEQLRVPGLLQLTIFAALAKVKLIREAESNAPQVAVATGLSGLQSAYAQLRVRGYDSASSEVLYVVGASEANDRQDNDAPFADLAAKMLAPMFRSGDQLIRLNDHELAILAQFGVGDQRGKIMLAKRIVLALQDYTTSSQFNATAVDFGVGVVDLDDTSDWHGRLAKARMASERAHAITQRFSIGK